MADVSSAPFRTEGGRFGTASFTFHLWTVLALSLSNLLQALSILAVPFSLRRLERASERVHWRRLTPILLPLVFFAFVTFVSIGSSLDPRRSLEEGRGLLSLLTLPLAAFWIRDRIRVRRIFDGIVVMAAICAVWGLTQFFTGYGDLGQRIRGPFSHYMTFAGVLLLADLALVARFACRKPRLLDWRWLACAVISMGLVGSLTRSAWVALVAALVVLMLLKRPRTLFVWVPAAVLAAALLLTPVRSRLVSIVDLQNPSNYDRLSMLESGLNMAQERPFFGLGPGMAETLYPIYRPLTAPRRTVPHLHNTYVQLAAEQGLFGLGAYLWLIGAGLGAALSGYRRKSGLDAREEELHLASFLGMVAFSVAGLFEANWLDTEVQRILLWLLAVPFILRSVEAVVPAAMEK